MEEDTSTVVNKKGREASGLKCQRLSGDHQTGESINFKLHEADSGKKLLVSPRSTDTFQISIAERKLKLKGLPMDSTSS